MVEPEPDGGARLRFGDGVTGRDRRRQATFTAHVPARRRAGAATSAPAGSPTGSAAPDGAPPCDSAAPCRRVEPAVRPPAAPTPSRWSRSAQLAPLAYRPSCGPSPPADYAAAAESVPACSAASPGAAGPAPGTRRRSPSTRWPSAPTTRRAAGRDRPAGDPADGRRGRRARAAGVRAAARRAVRLPRPPATSPGDVEAPAARRAVVPRPLPGGGPAFFHPDRFTFGQPLYVSDSWPRRWRVPGRRLGRRPPASPGSARSRVGDGREPRGRARSTSQPREVLRCDTDPNNPEAGRVEIELGGGAMTAGPLRPRRPLPTRPRTRPASPRCTGRSRTHAPALARMRDGLAAPGHDLALRGLARRAHRRPGGRAARRVGGRHRHRVLLQRADRQRGIPAHGDAAAVACASSPARSATSCAPASPPRSTWCSPPRPRPAPPRCHRAGRDAGAVGARVPGELPQTFETGAELEVRAGVECAAGRRRAAAGDRARPTSPSGCAGPRTVRPGRRGPGRSCVDRAGSGHVGSRRDPRRRRRTVASPRTPTVHPGWTPAGSLDGPVLDAGPRPRSPAHRRRCTRSASGCGCSAGTRRTRTCSSCDGRTPPGARGRPELTPSYLWTDYDVTDPLEVDGDQPGVLPDPGWSSSSRTSSEAFRVAAVDPDGDARFAISGPVTRVDVDRHRGPRRRFARRRVVVHAVSDAAPRRRGAGRRPVTGGRRSSCRRPTRRCRPAGAWCSRQA